MKKILLTTALVLGVATSAHAIPFQISDTGTIEITGGGLGISSYESLGTDIFDLDEGETSETIDFFEVYFAGFSEGQADVTIEFLSPLLNEGSAADSATYSVTGTSNWFFSLYAIEVTWGDPIQFEYSFGDLHSGIFELDLFDIDDSVLELGDSPLLIQGTITNIADPIPEPGTMMLFGAGLAGLAGLSRRRKKQ